MLNTFLIIVLVLWGMLGQVCGAFLWFWLTGWQMNWWVGVLGFIPFSLGGIVFVLIAGLIFNKC